MTRGDTIRQRGIGRRAFTLIEMMVVVTIILLVLAVALPAANSLWNNQKLSGAQNAIKGMLTTSRVAAQRPGAGNEHGRSLATDESIVAAGESGLFFYLDDRGVQRIVSIVSMAQTAIEQPPGSGLYNRLAYRDVFLVTADRSFSLSLPLRVVPRFVVEDPSGTPTYEFFDENELANNNYASPPPGTDLNQRHRNYFTMIYSTDGQLRVRRDVLIRDDDVDEDGLGDLTGLPVGYDADGEVATVRNYYAQDGTKPDIVRGSGVAIPLLIVEKIGDDIAVNFPSVDGLLVYDDAVFESFPTPTAKREFLLRTAIPFYVHRLTGAIVRGPIGETVP